MFKFKPGETVRDLVTGFEGIIVSRTDYISGCNRYGVQPKVGSDGKLPEQIAFDEPMLERQQVARITLERPEEPPG
jgi:hypothetical protein